MAKQTYQVKPGDTWMSLAATYKTSLSQLLNLNKGVNTLSTGMGVFVPEPPAVNHPIPGTTGPGARSPYEPTTPGSIYNPNDSSRSTQDPSTGHPGGKPAPSIPPPHTDTYNPAGTSGGRRYVSPGAPSTASGDVSEINAMISNGEYPPIITPEQFMQLAPEVQAYFLSNNIYVTDANGNLVPRTSGDVNNGGILPEGAMGTLAGWSTGYDGYGYGINWDGRPLDSSGNAIGARRDANGNIIRNRAQNERRASLNRALSKGSDGGGEGDSAGLVNFSWRV